MGRSPPAVVNGWGDTGTGPQEVQGGPRTGLLNRGNHERHGTHSVFTQLDGVYIPPGATQFTCSTTCRPYVVTQGRTSRRPKEVVPLGRPVQHSSKTLPGRSAGAAAAPATAGGRRSATRGRRRPAGGRRGPAGRTRVGRGTAARVARARAARRGPPTAGPVGTRPAVRGRPRGRPRRVRAVRGGPLRLRDQDPHDGTGRHHEHQHQHQDKDQDHGPRLLSETRSPGVRDPLVPRDGGMPPGRSRQSTLEQLQSFPAGWRP